jgi:tagatose 1,6-diphosphate aldolase
MTLSPGVYRRLRRCADSHGAFAILALDHRGNLIGEMERARATPLPDDDARQPVTADDVIGLKAAILRHLLPEATAALIDPDYGLPALIHAENDTRLPSVGLLAPLEVTDYGRKVQTMIPDWDVGKLARAGFDGAKLLLYLHPDAPDFDAKRALVDATIEQCRAYHLPLFFEPIIQAPDPARPLSPDEKAAAIIAIARDFSRRGVDVLKVEYPGDAALAALHEACAVPWTLLSAGAPFEVFLRQAAAACMAGAAGVIAGRAIWGEALALESDARDHFLATNARERMTQIAALCRALAQPQTARRPFDPIAVGWYRGS